MLNLTDADAHSHKCLNAETHSHLLGAGDYGFGSGRARMYFSRTAFIQFCVGREPTDFSMTIEPQLLDAKIANVPVEFGDEYLEGVGAIANYLGWNARKVRYARETGALPIRVKSGVGLYAFKSEILAALKTPDTLVPRSSLKAH